MALKQITEGAYLLALGSANAILLDGGAELALLWQGGRLLIAGDVGMNILGLGDPVALRQFSTRDRPGCGHPGRIHIPG
jgi:hypothetical protein